jgi:hypothetical protein
VGVHGGGVGRARQDLRTKKRRRARRRRKPHMATWPSRAGSATPTREPIAPPRPAPTKIIRNSFCQRYMCVQFCLKQAFNLAASLCIFCGRT